MYVIDPCITANSTYLSTYLPNYPLRTYTYTTFLPHRINPSIYPPNLRTVVWYPQSTRVTSIEPPSFPGCPRIPLSLDLMMYLALMLMMDQAPAAQVPTLLPSYL